VSLATRQEQSRRSQLAARLPASTISRLCRQQAAARCNESLHFLALVQKPPQLLASLSDANTEGSRETAQCIPPACFQSHAPFSSSDVETDDSCGMADEMRRLTASRSSRVTSSMICTSTPRRVTSSYCKTIEKQLKL